MLVFHEENEGDFELKLTIHSNNLSELTASRLITMIQKA